MENKILIITPTFKGGSWVSIKDNINYTKEKLKVIIIGYGKKKQDLPNIKIKNIFWPEYITLTKVLTHQIIAALYSIPLIIFSVATIIEYKPDIIKTNGLMLGFMIMPISKLLKINLVVGHHGIIQGYNSKLLLNIKKELLRPIDLVIANSQGSKEDLESIISNKKIIINEHTANNDISKNINKQVARKKLNFKNIKIILWVGRLDKEKGIDILLNSLHYIIKTIPNIKFIFCGDGEYTEAIKKIGNKYSLNIKYYGYIHDYKLLSNLYSSADFTWGYGDETYLARPMVESLFHGTPIIVNKDAAVKVNKIRTVNKELVPTKIGILLENNDPIEVSKSIINGIKNYNFKSKTIKTYYNKKYKNIDLYKVIIQQLKQKDR